MVSETGDGDATEPAEFIARRLGRAEQRIAELQLALEVASLYDPRTGLKSRNALLDMIEYQLRWQKRIRHPLGVLTIRLPASADGAHVAATVAASLRDTDVAGTWGDWTIGLLLPLLTPSTGREVWQRVRRHLPPGPCEAAVAFPTGETTAEELLGAAEFPTESAQAIETIVLS